MSTEPLQTARVPARDRQSRSLSKRLRMEVLKRDGFACRYCGAKAPDVRLHVDHVNPIARGGADDMLNFVTACSDCNAGKSDIPLSEPVPSRDQDKRLRELQAVDAEIAAREAAAESRRAAFDAARERARPVVGIERSEMYLRVETEAHGAQTHYMPASVARRIAASLIKCADEIDVAARAR